MGCLVLLGGFDDVPEVFRPFGPGERRRMLAVCLEISKQQVLQVLLGPLHALREGLPGEDAGAIVGRRRFYER